MKKVHKLKLLPIVLFLGTGILNAATPGAYVGAGAGLNSLDSAPGLTKDKESTLAGRVFLGYNFNQYFGLETNFSAFDKTRYRSINYPSLYGDYSVNAWSVVGKAYIPFSDHGPFNLYALLGVAKVYGKFNVASNSISLLTASDDGFVPTAGIGAAYDVNERVTAGLEFSGFGEKEPSNGIGVPQNLFASFSLAYKF